MAFFSFCAFSERLRGRELVHVRELQDLQLAVNVSTKGLVQIQVGLASLYGLQTQQSRRTGSNQGGCWQASRPGNKGRGGQREKSITKINS